MRSPKKRRRLSILEPVLGNDNAHNDEGDDEEDDRGKTGTTLKTKGHGYGKKVFASFVGMAPIDDPKICLLVVVDNPANGASGSLSAGPAAKEILENTLKYMLVKPK